VDHAQAFLSDQVPPRLRSFIPATLKLAYAAAKTLIKGEAILKVASARDNSGRIIQWAVDLSFERACKNGEWPFDFRWRYFESPLHNL